MRKKTKSHLALTTWTVHFHIEVVPQTTIHHFMHYFSEDDHRN